MDFPNPISKDVVISLRSEAAKCLLSLIDLVDEAFRDRNRTQLTLAYQQNPPIEDNTWNEIAFLSGVYGKRYGDRQLSEETRLSLWQAIIWGVSYEFHFRNNFFEQRANEAIFFLKSNSQDFIIRSFDDLEKLLPMLRRGSLTRLNGLLAQLADNEEVARMRNLVTTQIDQLQPDVLDAIKTLWNLLDKRKEEQNKKAYNDARSNPSQSSRLLTPLAGVIIRNAVYRYCYDGWGLSEDQLANALLLADFSKKNSKGAYLEEAQCNEKLLHCLHDLRDRSITPEAFVQDFNNLLSRFKEADEITIKRNWKDLITLVTRHLSDWRNDGLSDRVEAESWVRPFSRFSDLIDGIARQSFVDEVTQHGVPESIPLTQLRTGRTHIQQPSQDVIEKTPLSFLGPTRQAEFEDGMRRGLFPVLMNILRDARQPLLSSASKALADTQEIKPPRRTIHIQPQRNGRDLFHQARKDIMSNNEELQERALDIFEQGVQLNSLPEFAPLAREWNIYAKTRRFGVARGARAWLEEIEKRTASYEVVWNLAVFYIQMGRLREALDVLRPGIEKLTAPFSHLKLGLYCGVQILEQSESANALDENTQSIVDFLVENLPKLPLAECYLVWFLLTQENQHHMDVIEQAENIGVIQDLLARSIKIPSPEMDLEDSVIEQFHSDLQRLNLNTTWRIWINDYAEMHSYQYKAWLWLAEVCERSGDLTRASEALETNVNNQLRNYRRAKKENRDSTQYLHYLRTNLINLFEFFQRNGKKRDGKISFERYYGQVKELWDGSNPANNRIIKLTRAYLDELEESKKKESPSIPDGTYRSGEGGNPWGSLYQEIASVSDIGGLKELKGRLEAAFDLVPSGPQIVKDRIVFIRRLLSDICNLDESQWKRGEIEGEMGRINKAIQDAEVMIKDEVRLKDLKALVSAFQRSFEAFSKTLRLQPVPVVEDHILGTGIPNDITQTSLIIRIKNPGPSDLTNLRIKCANGKAISSTQEVKLDYIGEDKEIIVTLPVTVNPPEDSAEVKCNIYLKYNWGVIKELSHKQEIIIKWFSFIEHLREVGVSGYEFPNPYKYRDAIDFEKDDPDLFQGRDDEINLIRKTLMLGTPAGTPLYFHGIRRVGKTSLINRIVVELKKKPELIPVVVDLSSLDALTQSLDQVINALSTQILKGLKRDQVDVENINEVPAAHPNPLVAIEQFLDAISERTGMRKLILLVDEFQQIVADQTTALLGLLRKIYKNDQIWFVFSGRFRPEIIEKTSPRSQLSFSQRPIGFLEFENVRKILSSPVQKYGIEIPIEAAQEVYIETAGNPFLVSNIAYHGVERLNREHRTMLTPSDVKLIADLLSEDSSNFTTSSFSSLVLTKDEQTIAIQLAKLLGEDKILLPTQDVLSKFDVDIITSLEEKNVIQLQSGGIGIKGQMLARFLRNRLEPGEIPAIPTSQATAKKVGIFVDFENVVPQAAPGTSAQTIGEALIHYAAQFGQVVCQWACADPRNLVDPYRKKAELEKSGFSVSFPREELINGPRKNNLTDFLVLERITDERTHQQPDIIIIVSGDKDYFERFRNLLDQNYIMRIVAKKKSTALADVYREFEEARKKFRYMQGFTDTDFFVDDLDDILK